MVLPDARRGVSGLFPEIQDSLPLVHRETLVPAQGQAVVTLEGASGEFVCAFSTIGFVLVRP